MHSPTLRPNLWTVFFSFLYSAILPLSAFFISFLIWFYTSKDEAIVLYFICIGVVPGIILAIINYFSLLEKIYSVSSKKLLFAFIFYNLCIYSMFMGFPGFNLLTGLVAGFYISKKMQQLDISKAEKEKFQTQTAKLAGGTMAGLCLCTLIVIILEPAVHEEISELLALPIVLSKFWLVVLLIIASVFSSYVQFFITRFFASRF